VLASSPVEARRLVALNAQDASQAKDVNLFGCSPDETRRPPHRVIYRGPYGRLTIEQR